MTILPVSPDASPLVQFGAAALLFVHIGGGTLGMISGAVAVFVRKGAWLHRMAGHVFFGSMVAMATVGATVSPFIHEPSSILPGVLALYLVTTGWMAGRRAPGTIGRFETGAFVVALGIVTAGVVFPMTGLFPDQSPVLFYALGTVGAIAAVSDFKVIRNGGIGGAPRIARHLWRMCAALFIATGSFFLGQQKVMPAFMHGSPLLFIPALAPLALLAFWMIRVRFSRTFARPAASVPAE